MIGHHDGASAPWRAQTAELALPLLTSIALPTRCPLFSGIGLHELNITRSPRILRASDLPAAVQLRRKAGWNHPEEDFGLLIDLAPDGVWHRSGRRTLLQL